MAYDSDTSQTTVLKRYLLSHPLYQTLVRGELSSHVTLPMMSQETKSLNATSKPEAKEEAVPVASGSTAGSVELTAMVHKSRIQRLTRNPG